MKSICVSLCGNEVDIHEGDMMCMRPIKQHEYVMVVEQITDDKVIVVASGGSLNHIRTSADTHEAFKKKVENQLAWNWIIDIKRDGEVIHTSHPY